MFSLKSDGGIFYGWWIVIACSLLTFYGAGTFFYGFTVFVHPMAKELGWSMALISGAFSLYRLESGIGAPLAGFLLDRVGPKIVVMAGGLIWGAGFIYLSHVRTVVHFYAAFFVISFGFTFASGTAVPSALITKWFLRRRGRALGIFTAVSGLSGLLVPVLSYLIDTFGYTEVDFGVGKALLTPAFWLLSLATTIFSMTMSTLFVHIVPHLISAGIEARAASLAVVFITLCSVLGRAGFGWLSDTLSKKWLLISAFLLQGIGLFIFSQVHQILHLIPFVLAYAPSYGGLIVLRAAITGEYYGRKNFGTIYGTLVGMGTFGGIAGPVIAGLAYDSCGNFRLVFAIFALVSLFSALLLLPLKRPRLTSNTAEQI